MWGLDVLCGPVIQGILHGCSLQLQKEAYVKRMKARAWKEYIINGCFMCIAVNLM